MIHFQSKDNLVDWLIKKCPRPAIVRALEHGTVEHLGGFNPIPPSTLPGWILKVTSPLGGKWNVAVLANDITHRYEIRIIQTIPWKNWRGELNGIMCSALFCGDNPEQYKELRDET